MLIGIGTRIGDQRKLKITDKTFLYKTYTCLNSRAFLLENIIYDMEISKSSVSDP